jgi:hypothetical protein
LDPRLRFDGALFEAPSVCGVAGRCMMSRIGHLPSSSLRARNELRGRNEKVLLRIRLCTLRRSHLHRAIFILKSSCDGEQLFLRIPAMPLVFVQKNRRWKIPMLHKLLAAAAMVAVAYVVVPANAAQAAGGCSGPNLTKTETAVENMADGEVKIAAQKEIAAAQDSMLNGKMGACGMHLNKAMHDAMAE